MNNWIDLSNVPQTKKHGRVGYNWEKSIGCICNFSCEGVLGQLKIVEYDVKKHKFTILYNGGLNYIDMDSFKNARLRTVIGKRTKDFKVNIGEVFIDDKRNLTIINRKMLPDSKGKLRKMYNYDCHICNWQDGWIDEGHLLNGIGCSCCAKRIIVPYKNDLYTTNPELIKYFKNIEDTHKTTTCNKKKFLMVCPNCGNEQWYSTDDLMNHGFSCKKCGDGISYGEKFLYTLLKNLEFDFITQLSHTTFKWCKSYKYDFYIPNINTIIEVHGRQHYDDTSSGLYKYDIARDIAKENLAKENEINNYIIIDCRKSELDYIKNSIIKSDLLNVLDVCVDEIDWLECDRFTSKSFMNLACEYKNNHPELSTRDIGKIFHMARTTIQKYLQRGAELGICIYDKEFEKKYKTKEAKIKYYADKISKEVA